MTTSCPLGGCPASRDLAAENDNLRNHVRALTEDVARADTLATILDGAREGLARSGSRAKGVRDVQALLTASAVREGVQEARRRVLSRRRREDRGRAASKALSLLRERDAARTEVDAVAGLARWLVSLDTDMDARARVDLNQIIARAREALGTTQGETR